MTTRRQVLQGIAATTATLLTFTESIGQAGISVDEFAGMSGRIHDVRVWQTITVQSDNLGLNVGDILQISFKDQVTVSRIVSIVPRGDSMDLELVEERYE